MLGGSKDGNNRDVKDIEIYCEDGKNEIGKVGGENMLEENQDRS